MRRSIEAPEPAGTVLQGYTGRWPAAPGVERGPVIGNRAARYLFKNEVAMGERYRGSAPTCAFGTRSRKSPAPSRE